jgi:ribonucleoside-triphosphate reductase (thioredoxin)
LIQIIKWGDIDKMTLSLYQNIIHNRTYARKRGSRLEYFFETVDRYIDYLINKFDNEEIKNKLEVCRDLIKKQMIMPSMRLFFSAGDAVDAENAMAFNCKFQAISSIKSFADLLYSLLCTCGVGISVQHKYISRLPNLPNKITKSEKTIYVEDSRYGWGTALEQYLKALFIEGVSYKFDTKDVRDKGVPLITSGGFASGPEPLLEVRDFIENIAILRAGNKFTSVDCSDISCMIAQCAVQGGVRRAAIITLFDEDDEDMFYVKSKENLEKYPYRYNSNNTMVYSGNNIEKLSLALENAKVNGEPGLLFEHNLVEKMNSIGRYSSDGFGVNPCGEIILMPNQFCNLVETVLRPEHDIDTDLLKVEHATFLALLQATLTDYHFIDGEAKINQEIDPIIGVSLTGMCDCEKYSFNNKDLSFNLQILKNRVKETVSKYWKMIGLKQEPKGTTCVKPSGTVSQIVNSSSGVHARYAHYYIRRVLIGSDSKLYSLLAEKGVPYLEFDCIEGRVFEFPMKAPETSVIVSEMSALDQLNYVSMINKHWCDFNASVTIYVKKHEWEHVFDFLKNNKETIAVSFLPYEASVDTTGFLYLVYEEIDKDRYEEMNTKFIELKWEDIITNETEETSNKISEYACSGGVCSI